MPSSAAAAYQDLLEGKLITAVTTSTTTGVTVKVKMINGATPTWTTIAHRLKVIQRTATTNKAEVWQVAAGTTQSGQTVTLGTLTRALPLSSGTDFTGSGTAQSFAAGAGVFLAWDAHDAAQSAKLDLANTFSATQTISGTNELNFNSSATAVWKDGSGNLSFKDAANGTKTLSDAMAAAGADEKAKVSADDTTQGYLNGKLVSAPGVVFTENNNGSNETLSIGLDINPSDPGLELNGNYVRVKTKSGGGITRDSNGLSLTTTVLFGTGATGAPTWTAGASLDPTSNFQYTTATLPVGQTLTVSSINTPLIIHNTGDVTINGTVDMNGKGGAGSSGGAANGAAGNATAGNSVISGYTNGGGIGAAAGTTNRGGGGGSGGSSQFAAGTAGSNAENISGGAGAGAVASVAITTPLLTVLSNINRSVVCGGGGGGGGGSGSGSGGVGGAGGAGGGVLVWYIGGNLTLGASSVIRCSGADGSQGTSVSNLAGGSGGGGGAGFIVIVVAGTITNSGTTLTAAGGAGGATLAASGGGGGGAGGAGAAGKILIYSLSSDTLIAS